MDSASVAMIADKLRALPSDFHPWFDVCHIILGVLAVRKEAGRSFGWNRPLATWMSCTICSFAGSLICNPLLGKPVLAALKDEQMVMISTIVYALIFYCPKDLAYQFCKYLPVYVVICSAKEIIRAKKVFYGLKEGREAMPSNGSIFFIPIIIATLKGNGSGFAGPIVRLFRGDWAPQNQETIKPSVVTKLVFFAALALTIMPDLDLVYVAIVGLFLSVKLSGILAEPVDPIKPIEEIFWGVMKSISEGGGHPKDD